MAEKRRLGPVAPSAAGSGPRVRAGAGGSTGRSHTPTAPKPGLGRGRRTPGAESDPTNPLGGQRPHKTLRGQPGDSATEPCPRLRSPPGAGGWVPQRGAGRQGPAPYPKKMIPIPIPGRQHLSTPRGAFLALQKRRREGRARSFPALRGTACTARPERALQTLTIFFYFFFFK